MKRPLRILLLIFGCTLGCLHACGPKKVYQKLGMTEITLDIMDSILDYRVGDTLSVKVHLRNNSEKPHPILMRAFQMSHRKNNLFIYDDIYFLGTIDSTTNNVSGWISPKTDTTFDATFTYRYNTPGPSNVDYKLYYHIRDESMKPFLEYWVISKNTVRIRFISR